MFDIQKTYSIGFITEKGTILFGKFCSKVDYNWEYPGYRYLASSYVVLNQGESFWWM